jgi:hypothetical protein
MIQIIGSLAMAVFAAAMFLVAVSLGTRPPVRTEVATATAPGGASATSSSGVRKAP